MANASSHSHRPTIGHLLHRLYLAGAEVLAAALARQLQDQYNFIFLCLDEIGPLGAHLQKEGFVVINLGRRPGIDFSVANRLRKITAQHHIQLLHAHQYTPFFYASLSRWMNPTSIGLLPKIIFTEHGRHYPDIRKTKRVLANQFLLRRFDRVTAVGDFVKTALIQNEGISAQRIQVIHNGIDPAQFPVASMTAAQRTTLRQTLRQSLGISPHQSVVMQIARFHPVKDHACAIHAWKHVCDHFQNSSPDQHPLLVFVGDGQERPRIQTLAQELQITPHVRFLGVREDVSQLLTIADIFLLTSLSEGISVTLLEAMGAGLPIVATNVGGNSEVVVDHQTGFLADRSNHTQIAQHLHALLLNPDQRTQFGQQGHHRLLQKFTQQQMHQSYHRLYQQML